MRRIITTASAEFVTKEQAGILVLCEIAHTRLHVFAKMPFVFFGQFT